MTSEMKDLRYVRIDWEARAEAAEARCARLLGGLMMTVFPRCGDHGGPLVRITAHYEDGSEITHGHEVNREASAILQEVSALSDTAPIDQEGDSE